MQGDARPITDDFGVNLSGDIPGMYVRKSSV